MSLLAGLVLAALTVTGNVQGQSAFLAQAQEKFRAKDYAGALAELQRAEKAGAMGADEWNLLGSIQLRQRKFPAARDSFRRAVRADPGFWAARFNLGESDFREGNYAAARTSFEELLAASTSAAEKDLASYKIALTYVKERRLAEAQEAIEALKPADSGSYVYAQAALAYEKRDGPAAARWLARAPSGSRAAQAKVYADSFEAMGLSVDPRAAANLATKESNADAMLERWTLDGLATAAPLATSAPAPRNEPPANLANANEPTARALRSLPPSVFNPSVPAGPTPTPLPGAARTARTPEIRSNAPAPTQQFLDAFLVAAKAYQNKDYPAALAALEQAESIQPNQAEAANLRGLVQFKLRDFAAAERHFKEAIRLDPTLWAARLNLADIPFEFRNFTLARERLEQLFAETDASVQPRESEFVQYKIFLTLLLEGKETLAKNFLSRFGFNGKTPARYYVQAAMNFHAGDFDRAVAWMQGARREFPGESETLFAESLYRVGWLTEKTAPAPVPVADAPLTTIPGDGGSGLASPLPAQPLLPRGAVEPLPEPRRALPPPEPPPAPVAAATPEPSATLEMLAAPTARPASQIPMGPVKEPPRDVIGWIILALLFAILVPFVIWLARRHRAVES
ncbi:MAG: tetratricopeptide repeat protein [Verrucomicrobia bacterium]|nr:tetratricopeptide repeat protein [Verrucomicrobiota bacterium]